MGNGKMMNGEQLFAEVHEHLARSLTLGGQAAMQLGPDNMTCTMLHRAVDPASRELVAVGLVIAGDVTPEELRLLQQLRDARVKRCKHDNEVATSGVVLRDGNGEVRVQDN